LRFRWRPLLLLWRRKGRSLSSMRPGHRLVLLTCAWSIPCLRCLPFACRQGPVQRLGGKAPAGSYAIVPGGQRFGVQIDGKEVARLEVRPDSFSTLALRREAASYALTVIDDTADTEDALKAELRFYNLAAGCSAANLLLAPAGTAVFSAVAASASAARSVNPVRASLAGQCGHAKTAPQSLPHLEPGDHLSLFLTGSAAAPQLVIQPSRTDPFTR
jgi:alginate O-acetyltransferase complex protein AlgF